MDDNILRYTLRVNRTLFQKFRYVADYEGRSANREIEQYIKQRVKSFEEEHGEIEVKKIKHTHRLTPFRSIFERVFLIKQIIFNFQFSIFNLHKKLSYHRNCIGMTQQVCVFTHSCRCVAGFLPFTVFRQHPYHMLRQ